MVFSVLKDRHWDSTFKSAMTNASLSLAVNLSSSYHISFNTIQTYKMILTT